MGLCAKLRSVKVRFLRRIQKKKCTFAPIFNTAPMPTTPHPAFRRRVSSPAAATPFFCLFFSKNAFGKSAKHNSTTVVPIEIHPFTSTGKERDEETGYSYFGARYMDHALLTGWLSVDPMADKYPSLSPYNYCAWNPIRLVDPDGMQFDSASMTHINALRRTIWASLLQTRSKSGLNGGVISEATLQTAVYRATLDELDVMEKSNQMYHLERRYALIPYNEKYTANGMVYYDEKSNTVMILFKRDIGENLGTMAHELKHAYQFEVGDLSYDETGHSVGELYDFYDEREAYDHGAAFGGVQKDNRTLWVQYGFKASSKAGTRKSISKKTKIDKGKNIYRENGVTYVKGQRVN